MKKISLVINLLLIVCLFSCGTTQEKSENKDSIKEEVSSKEKTSSNAPSNGWKDLTSEASLPLCDFIVGTWDDGVAMSLTIKLKKDPDNAVSDFRNSTWLEEGEDGGELRATFSASDKCGEKVKLEDPANRKFITVFTKEGTICYECKIECKQGGSEMEYKMTLNNQADNSQRIFTRTEKK